MNKQMISAGVAAALGGLSFNASALLVTGAALDFVEGGTTIGVGCGASGQNTQQGPQGCDYNSTQITTTTFGSWFAMDADGNGTHQKPFELSFQDPTGPGVEIGVAQSASGSHVGPRNGSENPAFDIWEFFGNTGMHYTTVAPTVVSDNLSTKSLDFSGWTVAWNSIAAIDMGGGLQDCGTTNDGICETDSGKDVGGTFNNGTGLATITCNTVSCSVTSTFILDYEATVPRADASGFGGTFYALHLEGMVALAQTSSVPVPAAAWLFGSGLLGLVGVARRKQTKSRGHR